MRISKVFIWLSILAGLLMAFVSIAGIYNEAIYAKETLNWAAQAMGQDYINIFLALPTLIVSSLIMLRKNSLKAFLVWCGVLFYMIYSYILYAFFIHFGPLFLVYVAILGLSFYSLVGGLVGLDWSNLGKYFEMVKVKPASILLGIIGLMFYVLWLGDIIGALVKGGLPQDLDKIGLMVNPIQVLDMGLLLPGAIIASISLWKKRTLGYILAVPFMVFFVVMGIAIVSMMIVLAQNGFTLAVPQMIMMGIIISISLAVIYGFLRRTSKV